MTDQGPLQIQTIATIEDCARARAYCEAKSRGFVRPAFIGFRRDRLVGVDATGVPVFVWRSLIRDSAPSRPEVPDRI